MSEFTISCSACAQRITVNDEWIGQRINCPACQVGMVVPDNPDAPVKSSIAIAGSGQPPPPPVPKVTRLSVSALTAPDSHAPPPATMSGGSLEEQAMASYKAQIANRSKKSYTGLIVGVVAVVLIGGSAFLNRDFLRTKWKAWRGPTAAEIAATNTPPPPPPELTAPEIMTKVVQLYKTIPNYSSTGKNTSVLDMSAVNPALAAVGPISIEADLKLKMNRPLAYRIDMSLARGTSNLTFIGYNRGDGDWLQTKSSRTKLASHDQLFNSFGGFSGGVSGGVGDIVRLFIDDSRAGLAKEGIEWSREKDEMIAGQSNYVLAGTVDLQNFKVWINRDSFLISQTQVTLDGTTGMAAMTDAQIKEQLKTINGKEPSLGDIAAVKKALKIKGTITSTYDSIQTNTTFAATDFQPEAPATSARGGGMQPQGGQPQPGGRATQIVNGRRRGG